MHWQITNITSTSAAGIGNDALYASLNDNITGLRKSTFDQSDVLDTYVGEVDGVDDIQLPKDLAEFDCRNNRLAYLGLMQDGFLESAQALVERVGAERVGVFMGTSTSGIFQTELAYRSREPQSGALPQWYDYDHTHNNYSVSQFVAKATGAKGPCFTVSTACSSSAKVFANAVRAIEAGYCEAAIVGGVDSLCLTTLFGFNSLQLVSHDICRPCDATRGGISIGEAAGFAIIERAESGGKMRLLGFGESSDAYHMSSPHPEGLGALASMQDALAMAKLGPNQVGYVNMHGTGTKANDAAEAKAIGSVFGSDVPCSSTKGWTGHTLGAAGILEAAISYLCLEKQFSPCSLNTQQVDSELDIQVILGDARLNHPPVVLSNSFGFGGSNCSLVFSLGGI